MTNCWKVAAVSSRRVSSNEPRASKLPPTGVDRALSSSVFSSFNFPSASDVMSHQKLQSRWPMFAAPVGGEGAPGIVTAVASKYSAPSHAMGDGAMRKNVLRESGPQWYRATTPSRLCASSGRGNPRRCVADWLEWQGWWRGREQVGARTAHKMQLQHRRPTKKRVACVCFLAHGKRRRRGHLEPSRAQRVRS